MHWAYADRIPLITRSEAVRPVSSERDGPNSQLNRARATPDGVRCMTQSIRPPSQPVGGGGGRPRAGIDLRTFRAHER